MKKGVMALVLVVGLALVAASAEQKTLFTPGTLKAQAGLGYGGGLGLEGGADLSLGQFEMAPGLPLDWGVGAAGGFWAAPLGLGLTLAVQGHAELRFSWKTLRTKYRWLDDVESYTGLGLIFDTANGLTLGAMGGTSYQVDDRLAVQVAYYSVVGGVLGVVYKLD